MKNKKVAINSVVYTVSNLILKASNFLLLPLYTAFLTTEDYGVTNLANSFNNVLTYIIAFSLYSAVIRFYADVKDDKEKIKELYSTVIIFVMFSGCVFLAIMFALRQVIGKYIFRGIVIYPTILLIFSMTVFHCFYVIYQDILKAKQNSLKSAVTSLAYFFMQIGLNIYFVVYHSYGANGILLSGLICNFLGTVWMIMDLALHKMICVRVNITLLKDMLKYSIPILPHNLSTNIAELTSRIFLNGSSSLSTVGIYGISSQFGSVADTIQSSISNAFEPWFYSKMNEGSDSKKEIIDLTDRIVWIFGFILICLSLFSQEAVFIMTASSYRSVWKYVPFLVVNYALKIPYYFYVCILYYHKESTKYIFTATLGASILNVFLSYFFIIRFGIYGSIMADILAMIFRITVIVCLANRTEKIGFSMKSFGFKIAIIIGCVSVGIIPSYLFFKNSLSILNLAYKIIVVCAYMVLAISILARKDKKTPISFVKSIFRRNKRE